MSCRLFFVRDVFVLLLILLVSLLHLVLLLSRKTMGTQAPKKYKSGNLNPSATAAFRQSPNLELHVLSWQEPSPASWSTSTRITSHTFSHHNSQPAWRHICIPSLCIFFLCIQCFQCHWLPGGEQRKWWRWRWRYLSSNRQRWSGLWLDRQPRRIHHCCASISNYKDCWSVLYSMYTVCTASIVSELYVGPGKTWNYAKGFFETGATMHEQVSAHQPETGQLKGDMRFPFNLARSGEVVRILGYANIF